ncbi:Cation/H(+) antiporter, partial [Thalictrum thalictroides]
MNCNILEKAPCSVGIFIDRKVLHGSVSVLKSQTLYLVAVLYMGGNDDGETLAYGARMAEHPQVNLTVIRFLQFGCDSARERKLDNDVTDEFKRKNAHNNRIKYREEVLRDGEGVAAVIRELGNIFNLMMVGRHHKADSRLLSGLNEWNECPELGIVGDMLASPDLK